MSAIIKKVAADMAGNALSQRVAGMAPLDPYYEEYTDAQGRVRRRKRDVPPGLSKRDERILKKVMKRAHYLDKGFTVCGFRFGWTFFIGLIPVVGDVADASLNYFLVLRQCSKADIPETLRTRMWTNNAISAGVGFVPLVGDVILAAWKANSRNSHLLEEYLRRRGEVFIALPAEHPALAAEIDAKGHAASVLQAGPSRRERKKNPNPPAIPPALLGSTDAEKKALKRVKKLGVGKGMKPGEGTKIRSRLLQEQRSAPPMQAQAQASSSRAQREGEIVHRDERKADEVVSGIVGESAAPKQKRRWWKFGSGGEAPAQAGPSTAA